MKTKNRLAKRNGSASVEVIISVSVFMVIALVAFWLSAKVYAAIYGMNAAAAGAGLSVIFHF